MIANCLLCTWFRTPADKVGRAIYAIHLRTWHPDFQGGLDTESRLLRRLAR